jgi:exosortase
MASESVQGNGTGHQEERRPGSRQQASFWEWGMLAAGIVLFGQVLFWLFDRWMTDHFYSHGILVAGVSLWLAWGKRASYAALPSGSHRAGLPLVTIALLTQMAVAVSGVYTIGALALVVALGGLVLTTKGLEGLRVVGFPLFLFLFAIPIASAGSEASGMILTPMMEIAAATTTSVANALGLEAERSGTIIRLHNYTMQIVAPCSGMASLVSLMPLGALLGYLSGARPVRIGLMVLSAFPIAFVANIARLTLTALLGVNFGAKVASGLLHEASGVFTFLLGAAVMAAFPRGPR